MKPVDLLVDEHRLIEQVLNCLERMAEESARRRSLDSQLAGDAVTFFRTFVHGWHFPREEAYVTWAMGPKNASPTNDLGFPDHVRCRGHLHEMEQAAAASAAGDRQAVERFVEHANAYSAVLMKHVEDEEDRVFPAVEGTLADQKGPEEVRLLRHAGSKAEDRRRVDACIEAANRLADRFNVPRAMSANLPRG